MAETEDIIAKIISVYDSMPRENKCRDIFYPLVFVKRNSDIFEEKAEAIYRETQDEDKAWKMPQFHEVFVPEGARWSNVVKIKSELGPSLIRVFEELEENNESLEGVFSPIGNQILDISRDRKLENDYFRVIQSLSLIPMDKAHLGNPPLPNTFDKLLSRIMKECHYDVSTPAQISKLLASIVDPRDNMAIFDPFCGTGSLLLECERYANEHSNGHLSLFGQEIETYTCMYCKLSLSLNGCEDAAIANGDSILSPYFIIDNSTLKQFDRIVSVPPFGKNKWGYEIAEYDQYSRFRYGIPPKNSGDFGYIQHIIACLKENGKAAIVSPEGILFRSGPESRIRKSIVQSDIIEAVIALSSKLFYHTEIPTIITVINMDKSKERRGSILFISAEQECENGKRNKNIITDNNIHKIIDAYRGYKNIPNFCRIVNLKEIEDNDYSLSFSLYLDIRPEIRTVDIIKTLEEIQNLRIEKEKLIEKIIPIVEKLEQTK